MIGEKNKQIASNYDEIDRLTAKIKENEQKLHKGQSGVRRYTEEEFKKMLENLPELFEKASEVRKDLIARQIFSNFYFDNEKIVGFSVVEPFTTLLNVKTYDIISLGGEWEIRTPAAGFPTLAI